MDNRTKIAIWCDAAERFVLTRTMSAKLPLYVVTEYPKSGGSWFAQMLSEALGVPFPRNERLGFRSAVAHGHMLYSPLMQNVVCVFRDGRDAMTSLYFHSLFQNDRNSPRLVERTRRALSFRDYDDVVENMPRFLEYVFETESRSRSPFRFTWARFVRSWYKRSLVSVKYEELVEDTPRVLGDAVRSLGAKAISAAQLERIAHKYSFAQQAGRDPGAESKSKFLRKGRPGDWKEKFSKKACEIFDAAAGDELVLLGYEEDRSWVQSHNLVEV